MESLEDGKDFDIVETGESSFTIYMRDTRNVDKVAFDVSKRVEDGEEFLYFEEIRNNLTGREIKIFRSDLKKVLRIVVDIMIKLNINLFVTEPLNENVKKILTRIGAVECTISTYQYNMLQITLEDLKKYAK